ncbi:hypothetical protein MKEN_01049200 [Mycena kentingensis (nom. inval.)]|nr:hypothetical protein MKEN_01049200 [Mycena kentingensis (nom. inval.)]
MKALNSPTSAALPRSTSISSRFRPLSVHLDKVARRRSVDTPPASPAIAQPPATPTTAKHSVSSSIQLAAASIPRILRGPAAVRSSFFPKPAPSAPAPLQHRPRPYYLQCNESRCPQILAQGLYIAFEDDFVDSGVPRHDTLLADGQPFTHFISLSTRHSSPISQSTDLETGARFLKLRLPRRYSPVPPTDAELAERVHVARIRAVERGEDFTEDDYYNVIFDSESESEGGQCPEPGFTQLDARQLLAARDFLCGAGLDLSIGHHPSLARVLVTTPRDHRGEAVAAVLGYLSVMLRHSVMRLVRTQNSHPKILSIWKYAISEDCAAFLQEVARL